MLLTAGTAVHGQEVLNAYVKTGLDSNIVLRQKTIALDQAMLALSNARSYFQPSVNLSGSYTTGEGGRSIALPVGDLLNPVYSTLNQLTSSNAFPQIENVNQNFFPRNLYDVHVRTTMQLVNTDVWYGTSIRSQQAEIKETEILLYKRELVRDIKVAYYNYLSASEAVTIYTTALELTERNLKVTASLVANGKAVNAQQLRAQSEKAQVTAQLEQVRNQQLNAEAYFNFLLNRNLHAPINTEFNINAALASLTSTYDSAQIARREELKMLMMSERLGNTVARMQRSYWIPKVSFFLDLGSQSENWKFDSRSRYYLLGLQLEMPLYNGMRNRNNYRSSLLDVRLASLSYQQTQRQLKLSADVARNNMNAALARYTAATEQQRAAESYYRLISNGYAEGVNPLIELIDARTQLTAASVQLNVSRFEVLQAQAKLERETASVNL
ncbi:MAG: TolC family protein [Bacteroidia bacterium]